MPPPGSLPDSAAAYRESPVLPGCVPQALLPCRLKHRLRTGGGKGGCADRKAVANAGQRQGSELQDARRFGAMQGWHVLTRGDCRIAAPCRLAGGLWQGGLAAGVSQRPARDSALRFAGRPDEVSERLKVRRMQGARPRLGCSGLRSVSSPNLSLARTLAALLLSVQCGVVSCVSPGRPCRRCLCRRSVKAGVEAQGCLRLESGAGFGTARACSGRPKGVLHRPRPGD